MVLRRLTWTSRSWATLPLRIALGLIFIAHGSQKVFGTFGGKGLTAWLEGPAPLGLHPAKLWLGAAAFAELIGGILVLVGFLTRLGALAVVGVMAVAIAGVHWSKGLFVQNGGFEFPFALLCAGLALLITGGGRWSVDARLK